MTKIDPEFKKAVQAKLSITDADDYSYIAQDADGWCVLYDALPQEYSPDADGWLPGTANYDVIAQFPLQPNHDTAIYSVSDFLDTTSTQESVTADGIPSIEEVRKIHQEALQRATAPHIKSIVDQMVKAAMNCQSVVFGIHIPEDAGMGARVVCELREMGYTVENVTSSTIDVSF